MKKKFLVRRWIIWGLAVAFTFYEYFLRVSTSVMVPELMIDFNVDAMTLGTIAAFYLYAYGPMQLPVGLLMDRFGARKLLTFAAMICGLGSIIFGTATIIGLAAIGRFLIGFGSSFAFVGMIYICTHWFVGKKTSLLIGLGNSLGMLGSICGEGPLSYAVDAFGWRSTSILFGFIGIAIGLVILFFIRSEPAAMEKYIPSPIVTKPTKILRNLKEICSNIQTWINGFVSVGLYLSTVGFATLWATPFIQSAYGVDKGIASFASSMVFVGWLFGGPLLGYLSDHLKRRKPLLIFSGLIAGIAILPVIYMPYIPIFALFILLFCVGLASGGQLLTYSFAIELNPHVKATGTPIAFTNFLVMVAGSFVQPFIGYMLDVSSGAKGMAFFKAHDYQYAFICLPVSFFAASLLSLFLKESKGSHPKTPRTQEV